jgi:DNA modification methylase
LDLNFHNEVSTYSTHNLHAFAAKFPPQIPRVFIEMFTNRGDIVLDPMNGSGTSTLEAYLMERNGIGYDIDPLAVKLAKVKTTPLIINQEELLSYIMNKANDYIQSEELVKEYLEERFDRKTKEFIDYWFFPETQKELVSLILAIKDMPQTDPVRDFLEIIFSSIIITKSGGVSRARDLAHTRPHVDKNKPYKNAFNAFEQRFTRFSSIITNLSDHAYKPVINKGNAKNLKLKDNSVDLIITSPPYANAIDYMRAHKFSLVWLGYSISELAPLRRRYIGSEATANIKMQSMPSFTEENLNKLDALDSKKAAVLRKYFIEMRESLQEMYRVLIPGHYAILVVGTSTMRGMDVKTPFCLADIAEHDTGFRVEGVKSRTLDRDRRMLPFSRRKKDRNAQIEQRMSTEEIILLRKP